MLLISLAGPAQADTPSARRDLPLYGDWRTFTEADGLPSDKVFYVLSDHPAVWVGTEKGLAVIEDGEVTSFPVDEGLAYPVITSLAVSPTTGDLWIGTLGGLSRLSGGRFEAFNQRNSGLMNDVVYAVKAVGDEVWAATAAGLSVFNTRGRSWRLFNHENTLMHEPWCYALSTSAEHLFVAVWGGGVVEHDLHARTWKEYRDPDGEMEIDLFRDDGLIHDVTSAVSHGEGILWIGTYFGLSRYDGRRWRSYLEYDTGLPSNFINFIWADGPWAWICTDNGLAAFDGITWVTYGKEEQGKGGTIRVRGEETEERILRTASSIAHNYVLGIHRQGDVIWVATAAGLSRGRRLTSGVDGALLPGGESNQ